MTLRIIERVILTILLLVAAGMAIHTPLTLWLGLQFPSAELFIKAWKEVLMGFALLLLVIVAIRRRMIDALLSDRLMQLSLVFAGIHFLMIMVFQNGLATAGAGLLIDLRFVLYFVVAYGFLLLYPIYRRLFIAVFVGAAALVIGFALLQIFVLPKDILATIGYSKATISPYLTVDENPAFIRINSTLRGPNPLGAYAVVTLALAAATAVRWKLGARGKWLAFAAIVASLVTVSASYSRSSLIAAIAAVIIIIVVSVTSKVRKRLAIALVALLIVMAGMVYAFRDSYFVSNIILHDNPSTGAHIDSNEGHVESLAYGVDRMLHQPLGAGVGSTGSASLIGDKPLIIENQYLLVAHEVGWLGLIAFLGLFGLVMWRLWLRRESALALGMFASGVGLAIIGLLLPVWTDDTVSITWWGLAAVAVAQPLKIGKRNGTRKSN